MSGLSDVMAVFGFIDHAVVADPELTPKVAALLPGYDHGAAGWYHGMSEWIPAALRLSEGSDGSDEISGSDDHGGILAGQSASDLKAALVAFATPSDDALAGDDLVGRQLLSLAVLGRIWPSVDEAHRPLAHLLVGADVGTADLVRALQPLTPGQSAVQAGRLLTHLGQQRPGESWAGLLARAADDGLISPSTAELQVCANQWIVRPAHVGSTIAFETNQRIVGAKMSDFDDLFVPTQWTNFTPPWCGMNQGKASEGHDLYLEVMSTSCPPVPPFRLSTPLQFTVGALPDNTGTALQYRLAPDWKKRGGDGIVSVDEGSIVVREWQGGIHLITTKRLQFRAFDGLPPIMDAWIAQLVWSMGYCALAEYFVNRVTKRTRIQVTNQTGSGPVAPRNGSDPLGSGQLGDVWKREIAECMDGVEASLGKVKKGGYGAAEYSDDLGKFVKHVAHYGGELLDVATRLFSGNGVSGQKTITSGRGRFVSEPLTLPPTTASAVQPTVPVTLECSALEPGLMRSGKGTSTETIAAHIVRCEPNRKGAQVDYRLVVEESDLRGQPGGTYTGTVTARTGPTAAGVQSDAWIVIP